MTRPEPGEAISTEGNDPNQVTHEEVLGELIEMYASVTQQLAGTRAVVRRQSAVIEKLQEELVSSKTTQKEI